MIPQNNIVMVKKFFQGRWQTLGADADFQHVTLYMIENGGNLNYSMSRQLRC